MTAAAEVQRYNPSFPMPGRQQQPGSQATMIEQSRAIEEVRARVIVAQSCRRDMRRAWEQMREACSRSALADKAFYRIDNRGTGPSVHLLRELIRMFGNVEHGMNELSRNDLKGLEGESEVHAFCWDYENNSRSSRTFIVPHARTVKNRATNVLERKPIVDLNEITQNNNNHAARAVRECIRQILPSDFVQEAMDLCRSTIENGDGVSLQERIHNMVHAFSQLGISVRQLEAATAKARGQWDAADIADLKITWTTITNEGRAASEFFEPDPGEGSIAAEIASSETDTAASQKRRPRSSQPADSTKAAAAESGGGGSAPEPPAPNEPPAEDPNADPPSLEPEAPEPVSPPEPQAKPEKVGGKRVAEILALLNKTQDFGNDAEARKGRLDWLSAWAERRIDSINNLSAAEADDLLAQLTREAEAMK